MLYSKTNLPLLLWAEAMNTAVHVINRTGPTKQGNKTPYELWYGKPAGIKNLKIFGTECFVHIPKETRKKLDKKGEKGYLVGYLDGGQGYRVYIPSKKSVVLSRDVKFKTEEISAEVINLNFKKDIKKIEENQIQIENDEDTFESAESDTEEMNKSEIADENKRQLRDRKNIRRTDFYGCPIMYVAEKLPMNFKEAINSEKKDFWKETNNVSTPIETNWSEDIVSDESKAPYREAVGNLMFLQTVTRPDISFAVNVASRHLEQPRNYDWQLVKRISRYLKGTAEMGILYTKTGDFEAFSDADYAGDKETQKSTSGVVCKYANAAITWQSKRQNCVALSTTEAEHVSAALKA